MASIAEALEEVKREVEELGGSAVAAPADVADADAVFAAADVIKNAFGAVDVWINDAMVTVFAPVWQLTPEEFRRVTEVTYLGQVHGTMAALRHMKPANRGQIIQIGSALAYRGIPLQSALRSETRDTRLYQLASNGADSRSQPDPTDDHGIAGR